MVDIFERDLAGEFISTDDPEYEILYNAIMDTMNKCRELNNGIHSDKEIRKIFSEIIGEKVDETFTLMPPFYIDYGKNLKIGKMY